MATRPSWRGYLRWSLVSIPVQAINSAESGGGKIHMHQLHATCHSRIRYKKVCPTHGEVTQDEIVSGYEYSPGEYVIIDPVELDRARTDADKAIHIDKFVPPDAVDPLYFGGDTYYLLPDGEAGAKAYYVLLATMRQEGQVAIGQAVFNGKERLIMLRALDEVLSMSMLKYENEVRRPQEIADGLKAGHVSKEEMRLANMLMKASEADRFNIKAYEDRYTQRLQEAIDAKVAGEEIVQPPEEKEPEVINLMDALRKSVSRADKGAKGARMPAAKQDKVAKKLASARRVRRPAQKRSKTG